MAVNNGKTFHFGKNTDPDEIKPLFMSLNRKKRREVKDSSFFVSERNAPLKD